MDYSKFPLQRGIPPSSIGGRQARFLGTLGAPALHSTNADGSVSHKQGDRLWVEPGGQPLPDGFYSLGVVAGRTAVFASPNARGTFADRGAFMGDDGLVPWAANRLRHQQRGWGLVVATEYYGQIKDFNDFSTNQYKVTLARTRDGRRFELVGEHLASLGFDAWNGFVSLYLNTPTRLMDGTELVAGLSVVGVNAAGAYVPAYHLNSTVSVELPTRAHQVMYSFSADVLSPRARLGQVTYTRSIYPQLPRRAGEPAPVDFPQNNALNPGIDVYFSGDGGANWTFAGPQSAFQEFTDSAVPMDVPPEVAADGLWSWVHEDINKLFNDVVTATGLIGTPCPVSNRYSLALASVGYVVPDPSPGIGWKARRKHKIVAVDNQARTITEAAVLMDADFDSSHSFFGSSVAIGGGMLYHTTPHTTYDFRDGWVHCWFVTLGGTHTYRGSMPTPAWLTGSLFAIDRNTVGCTVYEEGAYRLYESRDLGATWKRRAVITEAPLPAKVENVNYLLNFEYVAQLLSEGVNANPMPGAPWACDERLEAPTP